MLSISCLNVNAQSVYDIDLNDIDGVKIDLRKYKGKYILFVNVASNCGFTKQYSDLEKLYQKYLDKLIVIGLPCNQFGGQEPGDSREIKSFCTESFGVTFLLSEKIEVKGENMHELYSWLTKKKLNGSMDSDVKWNFQKYIVNQEGGLVNYFYSTTSPLSSKIISILDSD